MKRKIFGVVAVLAVILAVGGSGAFAHECNNPDNTDCHPTPVVPDWRGGNYVPLFDIDRNGSNVGHDSDGDGDIDGDDARYDAQRWRDECEQEAQVEANQFCVWLDFGNSLFNDGEFDPLNAEPNEVHAGTGGSHCFLFEFAHNCEDHYPGGEGTHDAHGGAIYVDICGPTPNPDSKYCDDGLRDTQAGLTIMDHNPCGAPVPVVACIDEYHVVRPFDDTYTADQMSDSQAYINEIQNDPATYLCGKEDKPQYFDGCHDTVRMIDPR